MQTVDSRQTASIMSALTVWCTVNRVDAENEAFKNVETLLKATELTHCTVLPTSIVVRVYILWNDRGDIASNGGYKQKEVTFECLGTQTTILKVINTESKYAAIVRARIAGINRVVGRQTHEGVTELVGLRAAR
jgi:hypothetical protein